MAIDDPKQQRGAYAAFTPIQRKALWIGKIEEVLTLDWTEKERRHLQSVIDILNVYYSIIFTNEPSLEDIDKREVLEYRWIEYARIELSWSDTLLYDLIYTPLAMNVDKEISSISFETLSSARLKSGRENFQYVDCSCGRDSECNKIGGTCRPRNCNDVVRGCGTVFNRITCNGMCGEN